MAGFSGIKGDETIMSANNCSFDGTERGGKITSDGELFIGSSVRPSIRKGTLSSADSSLTITNGNGSIDLRVKSPLDVSHGGTGLTTTTVNQILYSSAANTIGGLPTANSSVLVTSAGGVPSLSTTLPQVTIPNIFGAVAIASAIGNEQGLLAINGAFNIAGAVIKLISDGATPNKFIRAERTTADFQIVNSDYTLVILSLTNAGVLSKCTLASTITGVTQAASTNNTTIATTAYADRVALGIWTDVTGSTQALAVQNGYITNRGGGVTYTLPATATLGDTIEIVGKAGLAIIAQNANQQIVFGSVSSTIGVGGTVTATNAGDCVKLRCVTAGASTLWAVTSSMGSWVVV